tara:strand:+ start:1387 stop:1881 length:495 start_codon:yes stop_codon:yes gene_type:complete
VLHKILKKTLFLFVIWAIDVSAQQQDFYAFVDTLTSDEIPKITVNELAEKKEFILLDVRSKAEFDISHIEDAIWVGEKNWDLDKLKKLQLKQNIVVYCSVGFRSEKLAKKLIKRGFSEVYNLYGGVFEWVNQGNSLRNTNGTTDWIHVFDKSFAKWIKNGNVYY